MNRALYAAGWGYVALCGLVLVTRRVARCRRAGAVSRPPPVAPFRGAAGEWFAQVKPFCNAVEVEVRQQQTPPPGDGGGRRVQRRLLRARRARSSARGP